MRKAALMLLALALPTAALAAQNAEVSPRKIVPAGRWALVVAPIRDGMVEQNAPIDSWVPIWKNNYASGSLKIGDDSQKDCEFGAGLIISSETDEPLNRGIRKDAKDIMLSQRLQNVKCVESDGSERFRLPPQDDYNTWAEDKKLLRLPGNKTANRKPAPPRPEYCDDYAEAAFLTRMIGQGESSTDVALALAEFTQHVRNFQAGVEDEQAGPYFYGKLAVNYRDGSVMPITAVLDDFAVEIERLHGTARRHAVWSLFGDYWPQADPALHAIATCGLQKAAQELGISKRGD